MENRNGLAVDADVSHATGTAERDSTLAFIGRHNPRRRITLAADKLFDVEGFVKDLRPAPRRSPSMATSANWALSARPRSMAAQRAIPVMPEAQSQKAHRGNLRLGQAHRRHRQRETARSRQGQGRLQLRHRRLQSHPHPEPHRSGRMTTDADGQTLRHLSHSRRPPATAASPLTPKLNNYRLAPVGSCERIY
jgi:hypothetical protein